MNNEKQPQKPRHRSRSYPAIDLKQALTKAEELYEKFAMSPAPLSVVSERWGYKKTSSSGLRTAAALLQYGLLEDEGTGETRKVRLTNLARRILQHPDDDEKMRAIREAALKPPLHRELLEKASLDDDILRWELTEAGDLNEKVVGAFIENFRNTLSFAQLESGDDPSDQSDDELTTSIPPSREKKNVSERSLSQPIPEHPGPPSDTYDLVILLPTGERAVLRMPDKQSAKTYHHLIRALKLNLELMRDAIVRDENDALIEEDPDVWKDWGDDRSNM